MVRRSVRSQPGHRPWWALGIGVLATAACGLPPATPDPGEFATLRSRIERTHTDSESVLRLSAGLRRSGDHAGSRQLLEQARLEAPEALEYVAAIAAIDEADGEYVAAREGYLRFLGAAGRTPLSGALADRPALLRGATAGGLAEQLVDGDRTLDHGVNPVAVVAVPMIQSPTGNAETERFAAVATEFLVRDLRSRGYRVIDWELSEAVRRRLASDPETDSVPLGMAHHLSSRVVVLGDLAPAGTDSLSLDLRVHRVDEGGSQVTASSLRIGVAPYAPDRARLSTRVLEMASGVDEGTVSPTQLEVADFVSRAALARFGAGLLLNDTGDGPGAREALADALRLAPDYPPIQERLEQVNSLALVRAAETVPFAEEILSFARSMKQTRSATRAMDGAWSAPDMLDRSGPAEVLGLDRIGAQVFLDLLITIGGA